MRTTLALDDDVLRAVKEKARREHRSAGEVLSDLARQALTSPAPSDRPAVSGEDSFLGFEPFPRRGSMVSNDLIDRLREEDGE